MVMTCLHVSHRSVNMPLLRAGAGCPDDTPTTPCQYKATYDSIRPIHGLNHSIKHMTVCAAPQDVHRTAAWWGIAVLHDSISCSTAVQARTWADLLEVVLPAALQDAAAEEVALRRATPIDFTE